MVNNFNTLKVPFTDDYICFLLISLLLFKRTVDKSTFMGLINIVSQELLKIHLPQRSDLLQEISSRCTLFKRFEHLIQLMKLSVLLLSDKMHWCSAKPGKCSCSNTCNPSISVIFMLHSFNKWWKLWLHVVMQRLYTVYSVNDPSIATYRLDNTRLPVSHSRLFC